MRNFDMKPRTNPLLKTGVKTCKPDAFDSPHVLDERPGKTKPELMRLMRKQNAALEIWGSEIAKYRKSTLRGTAS